MSKPKFSIVTASYNGLDYLKRCCASVADQEGVEVEHIIVDGGSTDGTPEWLKTQSHLRWVSEKDNGMYDAINKGLRMAKGDLLAYLNCDEQYLPGTLAAVADYFEQHPAEILFADALVIDEEGRYICSRQVIRPMYYHTALCQLNTLTASTFFRREILDRYNAYFDMSWRVAGDAVWMLNLLKQNARMQVLRRYTSAFTDTGDNLALSPKAQDEARRLRAVVPAWAARLDWFWTLIHRLRRLAYGLYRLSPFTYSIYTPYSPDRRVEFRVDKPAFFWRSRFSWRR